MGLADPKLQAEIITAAIALGEKAGTEGITMRGLAAQLEISATQIYQHFDGKRAILDELRLRANTEMLRNMIADLDGPGERTEAMHRVGQRYLEWALANPWRYQLLMENDTLADADFSPEQREQFESVNRETAGSIAMRMGVSDLPPPLLARLFAMWWAWLHGTAALILNKRIRPDQPAAPVDDPAQFAAESVAAATDTLLRAFAAATALAPHSSTDP